MVVPQPASIPLLSSGPDIWTTPAQMVASPLSLPSPRNSHALALCPKAHAALIGHPAVCDGKYTSAATFAADCAWCPRNFLHRHRVVFADAAGRTARAPRAGARRRWLEAFSGASGRKGVDPRKGTYSLSKGARWSLTGAQWRCMVAC